MVRKADPAQWFSADIVDGAASPSAGLLSIWAGYDNGGVRRLSRGR
jgi:hypothetical protein